MFGEEQGHCDSVVLGNETHSDLEQSFRIAVNPYT